MSSIDFLSIEMDIKSKDQKQSSKLLKSKLLEKPQESSDDASKIESTFESASKPKSEVTTPFKPKSKTVDNSKLSGGTKRKRSSYVYLRDVPKSVVAEAKRVFSSANTNTDAVAAYIAYKSGETAGLTDNQKELLDTTVVDDPLINVNDELKAMKRTLTNMYSLLYELEMITSYMLFDRLGFRRESPPSPRQVNINEPGMTDFVERLREVGLRMKQQEAQRKGRPKRQSQ